MHKITITKCKHTHLVYAMRWMHVMCMATRPVTEPGPHLSKQACPIADRDATQQHVTYGTIGLHRAEWPAYEVPGHWLQVVSRETRQAAEQQRLPRTYTRTLPASRDHRCYAGTNKQLETGRGCMAAMKKHGQHRHGRKWSGRRWVPTC